MIKALTWKPVWSGAFFHSVQKGPLLFSDPSQVRSKEHPHKALIDIPVITSANFTCSSNHLCLRGREKEKERERQRQGSVVGSPVVLPISEEWREGERKGSKERRGSWEKVKVGQVVGER